MATIKQFVAEVNRDIRGFMAVADRRNAMQEHQEYFRPQEPEDAPDPNEQLSYEVGRILQKVAMAELLTMREMKTLCFACGVDVRDVT